MRLPLTLQLHRSRRLDLLLASLHLAAMTATLLAALPLILRLLLLAAIAVAAGFTLRRLGRAACRLTLRGDGLLEIERDGAAAASAQVLAQSTVMNWLTVLLLRGERGREALTILPDALSSEDFRALRLWLRWRAELS